MKKQGLVLFLALAVTLAAFAGGKSQTGAAGTKITKENIKVGFVYIGSIHDEGYTQSHDEGRKALEKLGIKCIYLEDVADNADCETAIRNLIDQGCNVIYTTSYGFMDWTIKVAAEYPNIYFGHCSGDKRAANVSTYFEKIYQPAYLTGISAGLKTKANRIGYVGAYPIPEVIRGINAFALGVQSVNPNATVEVLWANTWYDPTLEKSIALELLNNGCDVMAQCMDTTAAQIAAQEKGAFAVGYNLASPTAAPRAYLTAALFHWEVWYLDDVQRILDGTWTSRDYWEGFSTGAVSVDTLTSLNHPDAAAKVEDIQAKMKAGTFDPFVGPLYDQSGAVKIPAGTQMAEKEIWNMGWFIKGVVGTIPQ
jgi:basic membrane protein A